MDDGFKVTLDRQWRPAVIAVSQSEVPKGSYQRYNQMSKDVIKRMVQCLSTSKDYKLIALSFNAGSWVRSGPFHIKAHITVDAYCKMLTSSPSKEQMTKLESRASGLDAPLARQEFYSKKTTKIVGENNISCWKLNDEEECKFSFLKLSASAVETQEIKEVVEAFKNWFEPRAKPYDAGFSVYMFEAPEKGSTFVDIFVNIDPAVYKHLFQKAKTNFQEYEEPKREYRSK